MNNRILPTCLAAALLGTSVMAFQATKPAPPAGNRVPVMGVTGCLKQEGNDWFVTNATEPAASSAGADSTAPTGPTTGKNRFQLIGVAEFNLAGIKDHTVAVKGLFVKATPVGRFNITSVKSLAATCPAK